MRADKRTQFKAAAVAIPLGFVLGCVYQMLKQKIGAAEAAMVYVNTMRESIPLALVMCGVFYFFGMLTLVAIGHAGAKANRLLGMGP